MLIVLCVEDDNRRRRENIFHSINFNGEPEEEKENKKIRLIRCLLGTGIFFFFQNEPPPLRVVITGFSLYVFLSS